jgi:hypothetical protein
VVARGWDGVSTRGQFCAGIRFRDLTNDTTVARKRSNKSKQQPDHTHNEDVVLLYRATPDGRGYDVLRKRGSSLQTGVIRPLEEGKPLQGEVVELVQRGDTQLFDVTVRFSPDAPPEEPAPASETTARGRPARVASEDYRRNWDTIWRRSAAKQMLN